MQSCKPSGIASRIIYAHQTIPLAVCTCTTAAPTKTCAQSCVFASLAVAIYPPPLRMPSISREKRSICPHPFCSIFSHERIFYRYFGYGYHLSSLTCPYIAHLSATLIPDLFCQQCSRAVRRSRSPLAVTRTAESNLAKHPFLVTIDDCHLSFSRAKGLGRLDRVWYIYGRTYSLS